MPRPLADGLELLPLPAGRRARDAGEGSSALSSGAGSFCARLFPEPVISNLHLRKQLYKVKKTFAQNCAKLHSIYIKLADNSTKF